MRYKLEKIGCYILIIFLLPYIITVFINGPIVVSQSNIGENMIKVAADNEKNSKEDRSTISMKDYAIGILAREISPTFELEAIKAQAIMIRTKIYKEMQENGSDTVFTEEFWTQEEMEEMWGLTKYMNYYNKLENAWRQTEGQVLTYEDELVYTPFFSLSNGSTRDGEEVLGKKYPYLKMKDCPLDVESMEQVQTITLDKEEIEVLELDTAGYVLKVRVGKEEVNGEEFRNNYNLASSCFSIHEYEGKIRITTRGVGHGIGLSQNTANKMAESGKTAKDILEYFFEGCKVNEVVDMVVKSE